MTRRVEGFWELQPRDEHGRFARATVREVLPASPAKKPAKELSASPVKKPARKPAAAPPKKSFKKKPAKEPPARPVEKPSRKPAAVPPKKHSKKESAKEPPARPVEKPSRKPAAVPPKKHPKKELAKEPPARFVEKPARKPAAAPPKKHPKKELAKEPPARFVEKPARKPLAAPPKKPPKKEPAKKLPARPVKKPVRKPPRKKAPPPRREKPPKKPEIPLVAERSREAEVEMQLRMIALQDSVELLQSGLDLAIQTMVNHDGTVDGELRIGNLPDDWRTSSGVRLLVATLSSAFRTFNTFSSRPAMGGAFWVSFGIRFGPQNEVEVGELADLYKRYRGLFQIGTYPTPAWGAGAIQVALTGEQVGLRAMVESLIEKRGLPPTVVLVRFIWTPDGTRPGHYKGEK